MLPKSKEARFEIINQCQFNCRICLKNSLTRPIAMMNYSLFTYLVDKMIKETNQYEAISFAGIGEPLINHSLPSMINYCTKKKLKTLVVTNGDLLTADKFIELQDAGLYSVRVSFHGTNPNDYSKLHGVPQSLFVKVRDQLDRILNLKNRTTKVLLTHVVMKGVNEAPLETWIKLFGDKPDSVEVLSAHNWSNSLPNRNCDVEKMDTCGRIFDGPLQVQADGTINSCCFDWDGKLTFGDFKYQTLKQIFSSKEYTQVALAHQTGMFTDEDMICTKCDQRNKDKNEALLYSSSFEDKEERIKMTSTNYDRIKK